MINSLWVKLSSKKVGRDHFGNEYFLGKNKNYLGKNKRFVIYNGTDQSSKVPPVWHAWLHYLSDELPTDIKKDRYSWQQEHIPNLTGTKHAYNPSNSTPEEIDVYSKWTPKQS